MNSEKEIKRAVISKVIAILKKESVNWKDPFVSHWARVEKNPFTTLISCILSLRTKDDVTAKASTKLLIKYNTPEKIAKLSAKQIEKLIFPVGFYKTKAKRIKELSETLISKYQGTVPGTFEELINLKGVGPKTASITIVYGFNKPDHIAVDSHVFQITNRLGWVSTTSPEKTQPELEKIVPRKYWYDINELLVKFGQNICVPVSPFCSKCPVRKYCPKIGVGRSR